MEKLFITFKDSLIGELQHEAEKGYSFIYNDQWIQSPDGFSLSPVLDKKIKKHLSFVGNFFQNLLPEGKALEDLSYYKQVSKSNVMALLAYSGKDIVDEMAMAIGDEFIAANVSSYDWITLANENKIPLSILLKTLNKYAYAIEEIAEEELKNKFYGVKDKKIIDKIFNIIKLRSRSLRVFVDEIKCEIKAH